ncbi:M23 family metallopeptidase [Gulosibacter chungangensis]|uniref:M23 family metallopeptidase n=1 Tax=Gulosibacter chungangensis TaxID=979746 RepID=A0A7J5BFC3_9MICO|nr:M23 family metallopeptidase [Gulosibacter chungangensis]KAB1644934.1 M23 family metallopeptidase [Gulosibacter chungangensis]
MSSPIEQSAAPLSRRERRELEREAERREALAKLEAKRAQEARVEAERIAAAAEAAIAEMAAKEASAAEVSTEPVFMSRRERREAERAAAEAAAAKRKAAVAEATASDAPAAAASPTVAEATTDHEAAPASEAAKTQETPAAPVAAEAPAEPVFMSRRERREAERRAALAAEAKLEAESARAAEIAVAKHPELFAKPVKTDDAELAPVAEIQPAATEEKVFLPETVDTAAIETLDVRREPVVLAPVVSLDEVRAARAEAADIVPAAPEDEPEVEVPESFRSKDKTERADRIKRSNRAASSAGRLSGSMVALSFVAGTVVLGAGSAAGLSLLNSGDNSAAEAEEADVSAQSFQVDANVTDAEADTRLDEVTAVTSIGTAAAANLATGVELPDSNAYTNDITANVQWPFPMGVQISSEYGYRVAPTAGASSFHGGVDLTPGLGTPVGVIADGVVTDVDLVGTSGSGIYVEVEHMIEGQRVTTVYAHLKPESVVVEEGQTLSVGDEIGEVGNTGISTGPHLHLEVHVQGKYVDPIYFLTKLNVSGVKTEVPSSDDGKSIALGGDEKLAVEDSHALIDELFSDLG